MGGLTTQQCIQLTKLRSHFHSDVRKMLYGDSDDRLFFDNLKVWGRRRPMRHLMHLVFF